MHIYIHRGIHIATSPRWWLMEINLLKSHKYLESLTAKKNEWPFKNFCQSCSAGIVFILHCCTLPTKREPQSSFLFLVGRLWIDRIRNLSTKQQESKTMHMPLLPREIAYILWLCTKYFERCIFYLGAWFIPDFLYQICDFQKIDLHMLLRIDTSLVSVTNGSMNHCTHGPIDYFVLMDSARWRCHIFSIQWSGMLAVNGFTYGTPRTGCNTLNWPVEALWYSTSGRRVRKISLTAYRSAN